MYHRYFGLEEPAFAIAVNPKYLYLSRQHKEAIAHLVYGIQGGGFVLLSGEVGTGKTTVIRQVLNELPQNTEIAFILNPMAEVEALLISICEELRISYIDDSSSKKQMTDAIQERLLYNFSHGKRTVLLIDEAQLLSIEILEQIRLLTNLETETEKLMQIILVGQPEIHDILAQPRMRQLSQRITARFNLTPLDLGDTKHYIEHRLRIAGQAQPRALFPRKIIKRIHRFSGGIPRLINIICERSLIGAYGHNNFQVDSHIFNLALKEIEGVKHRGTQTKIPFLKTIAAISVCVVIGVSLYLLYVNNSTQNNAKPGFASKEKNEQGINAPRNTNQESKKVLTELINEGDLDSSADKLVDKPTNSSTKNYPIANDESISAIYTSKNDAYRALFDYYNVSVGEESHPCWQTREHQLTCMNTSIETWDEMEEINRPAILSIITKDKLIHYIVLLGIAGDELIVADTQAHLAMLSKRSIGELWNGSVIYLWRKPPGFSSALAQGSSSAAVAWVAKQLAIIDRQDTPITQKRFTPLLKTRVEIFQANHGLKSDGIIGEQTIMKINERTGISPTLLKELPTVSPDQENR